MKATDIVRRVDDLGRSVIPKEIRQTSWTRSDGCIWGMDALLKRLGEDKK